MFFLLLLFCITTLVPSIRRMSEMINFFILFVCKDCNLWIDNETLHTNLISIKVMNVARVVDFSSYFPWNIVRRLMFHI